MDHPEIESSKPRRLRWGEFDLAERIAVCGDAEVWRARDAALDREIALLLLPARDAEVEDVLRRARLLARVRHQKVATIYGASRVDEEIGIAMEFAEDTDLAAAAHVAGRLSQGRRRHAFPAALAILLVLVGAAGVRYVRSSGLGAAPVPSAQLLQFAVAPGDIGRPSFDGRMLPFVDRRNGALAIMHIENGSIDVLMDDADVAAGRVGDSVASPDGFRVAYQWYADRQELRIIDRDSRRVSVAWRAPDDRSEITPTAWSRDGTEIAGVVSRPDHAPELFVLHIGDPHLRMLHAGIVASPSFSDDGQFLVFDERDSQSHIAALRTVDLAADQVHELDVHGDEDVTPFWSAGFVTYASKRTGGPSVWRVRIDTSAHVLGAPTEVPGSQGVWDLLGVAQDGSIVGEQISGGADVIVANLDGTEAHEISRGIGSHFSPDWSADGERLAYLTEPLQGLTHILKIHDLRSGTDEAFDSLASSFGRPGNIGYNPRLSPDGHRVLLRGPRGFFLYDLGTHHESRGFFEGRAYGDIEWDDDSHVFVLDFERGIYRVDVDTGAGKQIYSVAQGYSMGRGIALSPDRARVAFVLIKGPGMHEANIAVVNRDGSGPHVLLTRTQRFHSSIPPFAAVPLLLGEWTADGRDVLYAATEILPSGFVKWETELWAVPADGGAPSRTGLSAAGLRDMRPAPDGKRIAYTRFTAHTEVLLLRQQTHPAHGGQ